LIGLDELERDALTELVNIGVSRAASGLRKMVAEQVMLSVPSVEVVTRRTAASLIGEREVEPLVAVRQDFSGAFAGRAMLIFPHDNSLELLRAVVGDEVNDAEMADMEQEALAEIGNVVLNGCLASMANMLQVPLSMSLPQVMAGDSNHLFDPGQANEDNNLVLFLYINFALQNRDVRGYIAMLMDLPSLASLKALIGEFIARVLADDLSYAG
jgi:chemotaxis protein CheC